MQDAPNAFDLPMLGLKKAEWLAKLAEVAGAHGFYQELGSRHASSYIDGQDTLLVTFETIQGIQALSDTGQPIGFDLVRALGWSHLCVLSDGDTWFRNGKVFDYFDNLTDDGFFDEFDRVIFYGAGPCGYAAAAFSVAAPGATVVAIQPQATLDPTDAGWDDRFVHMRRTSFTDRYGYAPDMIEGAEAAFILFDPRETLDAMHASLFRRPNVTALRMPFMGAALQSDLLEMQLLYRVLAKAGARKLTPHSFARITRARRDHPAYLRNLLAHLDAQGRTRLVRALCENVVERLPAPKFKRRLDALNAASR
ncbi:hypothetical protein [Pseudaestuariivita atlantica]|uniref:Phosphoadenosine phosphosulfate reductase n=1 Tax=Pseudaestuariivita atlantica TaxID=1317121 RepID=A0A0L1JKZ5_9RHOB|nr:hypothetical protein [Pseudaestuariivita atlantica]KNG92397.1 phosphoadenosine phosphosulfate reductase [Pseudaestuariivita atlantica]